MLLRVLLLIWANMWRSQDDSYNQGETQTPCLPGTNIGCPLVHSGCSELQRKEGETATLTAGRVILCLEPAESVPVISAVHVCLFAVSGLLTLRLELLLQSGLRAKTLNHLSSVIIYDYWM